MGHSTQELLKDFLIEAMHRMVLIAKQRATYIVSKTVAN
jgi:hypothetical protein